MTSSKCAPIDPGGDLVAPLLEQIDCQVAYYVEATYGSLFGPFGFLEPVLTGALTIYVAFFGLQLITGRGSVSLSGLAPRVLLIGLILAFATRWAAYQTFFFDLLYGGADQLAALMIGAGQGAPDAAGVIARLDIALQNITGLASNWNETAITKPDFVPAAPVAIPLEPTEAIEPALPLKAGAVNLLWFSAILFALSTVGMLIITKVLLGLLLAIGPVMLVLAIFSATRGLFEGWLRTMALYALAPVFTMALAAGALQVVEPIIAEIRRMHALGDSNAQAVFVLAIAVFVFALLVLQLLRMCAHLTAGWRLPVSADKSASDQGHESRNRNEDRQTGHNGRVADMVVAVERAGHGLPGSSRARNIARVVLAPAAGKTAPTLLSRRTRQQYRGIGDRLGHRGRLA